MYWRACLQLHPITPIQMTSMWLSPDLWGAIFAISSKVKWELTSLAHSQRLRVVNLSIINSYGIIKMTTARARTGWRQKPCLALLNLALYKSLFNPSFPSSPQLSSHKAWPRLPIHVCRLQFPSVWRHGRIARNDLDTSNHEWPDMICGPGR